MKRAAAIILSIILCMSAAVFAIPASAAAESNLFLDASYVYQDYNTFLNSCSDTGATCLNDGKWREVGGTVDFNDFYGVAGTTVEVAGTYDSTIIEFTLEESALINRLVFRNVRRSGNRYMNIVSIEVSGSDGIYTTVSFEEESVTIDGAPLYDVDETTEVAQYFDITAKFSEAYSDVAKVRITLNTQHSDGSYSYVVSLDEIEAYGSATGPYNAGADVVIDGEDSVNPGESFTVNVYLNNITAANGFVGCDLPLIYDKSKLQLDTVDLIVPSAWGGKAVNLSSSDKNADPYWLRLACDADDLLTNSDYYVKSDNSIGFSLKFIALENGTAEIKVDNNIETGVYILAVDAVGFKNYGANGAAHTVTISGDPVVPTYIISYNANGGEGAPASQTKVKDVAAVISGTIPTREGYTFLGWAESAGASTVKYQAGDAYAANANVTLYAVWSELDSDEYLIGDVNLDGFVDNLDAAFVLRYDAMLTEFDSLQITLGDVNGDGDTNSLDAAQILKFDAALTEGFGSVQVPSANG